MKIKKLFKVNENHLFLEARAEISGPTEKFLKPGSTLRLACKVLQSTEPPHYIFWYHNNRMINYDTGVNVSTESDNRYSELVIAQTSQTHSGNYSCVPNSAAPASTFVHIFNGKYFYLMDPRLWHINICRLMKE